MGRMIGVEFDSPVMGKFSGFLTPFRSCESNQALHTERIRCMFRKDLAVMLLLSASLLGSSGCTGYYSFGRQPGSGLGLFRSSGGGPCNSGSPTTSYDVEGIPSACEGPYLFPQGEMGPPAPVTIPTVNGAPRLSPTPQSNPLPYIPNN